MAQLTPLGLVKILALVTAIMVIPMVGGAIIGLVADTMLGTSPLYAVAGLAIGTVVAAVGIWQLIRVGTRRGYGARRPQREP